MPLSKEAKWNIGGLLAGLFITITVNLGAESFRKGALDSRVLSVEKTVEERASVVEDGIRALQELKDLASEVSHLRESYEDSTEQLERIYQLEAAISSQKAYSISHSKRIDALQNSVSDLNADQKVTNVILQDLTGAVRELTENTKALTRVVKDVAVLEEKVKNLEGGNK